MAMWREDGRGVAVSSQAVWLSCGDDEAKRTQGRGARVSAGATGEREEEISRLEVVEREEQRSDFLSEQVQYIPTVQYRQDDGNMAKRACVC